MVLFSGWKFSNGNLFPNTCSLSIQSPSSPGRKLLNYIKEFAVFPNGGHAGNTGA